jgi:Outer membrane efflux protein
LLSLSTYRELGINQNPEIQAAMEAAEKARQGVRIAKAEYIPDIGAFARYPYQNGVPFLVHNNGSAGVRMSWKVFDWGKRSTAVGKGEAQPLAPRWSRRGKPGVWMGIAIWWESVWLLKIGGRRQAKHPLRPICCGPI